MFSSLADFLNPSTLRIAEMNDLVRLEFPNLLLKEESYLWNEESFFKTQMSQLSNYLLLDDYNPHVPVNAYSGLVKTELNWINKGEVIAGSFAIDCVVKLYNMSTNIKPANDLDIYFKSREDADQFATLNNLNPPFTGQSSNPMCQYFFFKGKRINLIYGVSYETPEKLISSFDFRACSIAIDPNTHKIHLVHGSIGDIRYSRIVYNPVPRNVSVARLAKYLNKGLTIDPHQRLFFAELVRSNLYSAELELLTGAY